MNERIDDGSPFPAIQKNLSLSNSNHSGSIKSNRSIFRNDSSSNFGALSSNNNVGDSINDTLARSYISNSTQSYSYQSYSHHQSYYKHFYAQNLSAVPVSITLRNFHLYSEILPALHQLRYANRKRWHSSNHPPLLLKTKLEIFCEDEKSVEDDQNASNNNNNEEHVSLLDTSVATSNKVTSCVTTKVSGPSHFRHNSDDVSALSSATSECSDEPDSNGNLDSVKVVSSPLTPAEKHTGTKTTIIPRKKIVVDNIIYSKVHEASFHPEWRHISFEKNIFDKLGIDLEADNKEEWYHDERYKSMKARVSVSLNELECFYRMYYDAHEDDGSIMQDTEDSEHTPISPKNENSIIDENVEFDPVDFAENQNHSSIILATIPLHPILLRRLPPNMGGKTSQQQTPTGSPTSNPSSLDQNNINSSFPSALPPNSLLVQYSDGTTRILPPLYKLLHKKQIISENSLSEAERFLLDSDQNEDHKRTIRFSDAAFDQLKSTNNNDTSNNINIDSNNTHHGNNKSRIPSVLATPEKSSHTFDEDLFSLLGNKNNNIEDSQYDIKTENNKPTQNLFDDVWSSQLEFRHSSPSRSISSPYQREEMQNAPILTTLSDKDRLQSSIESLQQNVLETPVLGLNPKIVKKMQYGTKDGENVNEFCSLSPPSSFPNTKKDESEKNITRKKILMYKEKVARLKDIVKINSECLIKEELHLKSDIKEVKSLLKTVKGLKANTEVTKKCIDKEQNALNKTEFLISVRQIKMLKQLRLIYPIQSLSQNRFAIRNLEIPTRNPLAVSSSSSFSSDSSETLISSALGFTSHLVLMISKYLCIDLRYKILFNASKSAIFSDSDGTDGGSSKKSSLYPLFKDRLIEKEHFEHGFYLLNRNVDCLLRGTGLAARIPLQELASINMLQKLDWLLCEVIEGREFRIDNITDT